VTVAPAWKARPSSGSSAAKPRATIIDPQRVVPAPPATPIATVGAPTAATNSTSSGGSSITSPVRYPFFTDTNGTNGAEGIVDTKRFTTRGWTPHRRDVTNWPVAEPRSPISTIQASAFPTAYEFAYYGSKFELQLFNDAGARYQLWIDGLPVTQRSVTAVAGTAFFLPVDFGTPGWHWIRFRTAHSPGFIAVITGPTDTLVAHKQAPTGQMYAIGDSFADGANGVGGLDTYPHTIAALLGLRDFWVDGEGGTGLIATGGAPTTKEPFLPRLQRAASEPGLNPDFVVLQVGSTNDFGLTGIQAASAALVAQARSQWPNAYIVAVGNVHCVAISSTELTNHQQAIAGASGADLVIDAVTDGWYAGTGKIGALTGTGNADVFRSSDGTHPTQDGHDFIGSQIAKYIQAAIA
jgi:lysophospholipase L1-like esterase